jgi:hypothetical protein
VPRPSAHTLQQQVGAAAPRAVPRSGPRRASSPNRLPGPRPSLSCRTTRARWAMRRWRSRSGPGDPLQCRSLHPGAERPRPTARTATRPPPPPAAQMRASGAVNAAAAARRSFVKALYRSAAACRHLGKLPEARQQLLEAATLEPANKEVRRRQAPCRRLPWRAAQTHLLTPPAGARRRPRWRRARPR